MWIKLNHDYLNLEQVVSVHFLPDDDGTLTATVETVAPAAKHYLGADAERLRKTLEDLCPPPAVE
jgi:hypothetical protein